MNEQRESLMRKLFRKARKTLVNRVRIHSYYRTVFSTPQGEEVLRHIMRVGFVTRSTFVAGDPNQTAMNEGMRRLALSILRFVHRDQDTIIKQIEQEMEKHDET